MPKKKGKLFIGTSGWVYRHWEKIFYPENLASKDKLKYFSKFFKTTEVNYSFYHLPKPETYRRWCEETPIDFVFSLKASRFITHVKRLKDVKEPWKIFLRNALNLEQKLGPILFQFPPNFKATEENIKRLEDFLKLIRVNLRRYSPKSAKLRYATEFRHKSWCSKKIYGLLKKYNIAWVIADSPNYPRADVITSDFVYIRMHGGKALYGSKYTKKELQNLAQKMKKWQKAGLDIYCYFNNDAHGYAIRNAEDLTELFSENKVKLEEKHGNK